MTFRQLFTITWNTMKGLTSDPFFLILNITTLLLLALISAVPTFSYNEHQRILRDQCLGLFFIVGCIAVTIGCIRVFTDDIRRGAIPILSSHPIRLENIILGKWLGIIFLMFFISISFIISYLWVSEIAFHSEYLNVNSLILYLVSILLPLLISAMLHYISGVSYIYAANLAIGTMIPLVFCIRLFWRGSEFFDWIAVECAVGIFFGIVAFSATLLPIAVLFDSVVVMVCGVILFFLGLVAEHLAFSLFAGKGIYAFFRVLLPNWQLYWFADRVGEGKHIPYSYFLLCGTQVALLFGLYFTITTFLYDRMEMGKRAI